jgi:uncharacterized protein YidB (DUF937 family)
MINNFKFYYMLEQLLNSLKSEVGGQLSVQNNLQPGHLDQIFSIIGNVARKEVTGHMLQGKLSEVMNLFSKSPNTEGADQLQSNISSGAVSEIINKLGLSPDVASNITSTVIPGLLNKITNHNSTTPDDDPSPLHELFGTSGSGDILGTAKNLLGGLFSK